MILGGGAPFPFPVQQPPTLTVSCLACRCAKKFCDRKIPCGRCRRLQIECVPQARGRSRMGQAARQSTGRPAAEPRPIALLSAPPDFLKSQIGQLQGERAYPALLAACRGLLKFSGRSWGDNMQLRRVAPDGPTELALGKATAAITCTLGGLWRSGKLDRRKADYIRMHLECMQVFAHHSREGRELFSFLQEVTTHGPQSVSPQPVSLRDALIAQQPHRGKEWVDEICTTGDAWLILFEIGVAQVEVSCGLLMGQMCVTSEEFRARSAELKQLPPLVLGRYLSLESTEPFFEAMAHCMYMHANHLERNVIVEVLDRDGILHQSLATIRSHWHVNKAVIAVRFWHIASLTSLTEPQLFGHMEGALLHDRSSQAATVPSRWAHGGEGFDSLRHCSIAPR